MNIGKIGSQTMFRGNNAQNEPEKIVHQLGTGWGGFIFLSDANHDKFTPRNPDEESTAHKAVESGPEKASED